MSAFNVPTKRRTASPALLLAAMGAVLLLPGTALVAVSGMDPVPATLSATHKLTAVIDDTDLARPSRNGSRRLRLIIHRHRYMLKASREDVERVNGEVAAGDQVVLYSLPIAGGEDRIWQLEKGDRILQAFQPMRDNATSANKRTRALANGMQWVGGVLAAIGLLLNALGIRFRLKVNVDRDGRDER